jgi:hypothetical protein
MRQEYKVCNTCHKKLNTACFSWQNERKGKSCSRCKICSQKYYRNYYKNNKAKILRQIAKKRLEQGDKLRESSRRNYKTNKHKIDKRNLNNYHNFYKNSLNRRFQVYKARAKKIKIFFEISKERFDELTNLNCFYCGEKDVDKFNGLDRVDNNKGYAEDNVVPCCKVCNIAKHDLEQEKFKEKIIKIYKNWIKE